MKTVGEILAEARLAKGITLSEAERNTKIRIETIQALEENNFAVLPSSVYIRGFIKNYADYLGLDPEKTLAVFRRQFEEKPSGSPIIPDLSPKNSPKLMLTPGRALGLGISVLVLSFMGYLLAQYQSFAAAPLVDVTSPKDGLQVNNGTIEVSGRTDPDATLRINGQEVQLTESGAFSASVTLPDGTTELTFSATNKLGRVTTVSRLVNVSIAQATEPIGPAVATSSAQPAVAAAATSTPTSGVTLTVNVGPNPSDITVTIDNQPVSFESIFQPHTSKTFQAQSKIVLKAGNAGSTDVVLNGKDLGKLGSEAQVVTRTYP